MLQHAFVAQRIEQIPSKDKVVGSNPTKGTNQFTIITNRTLTNRTRVELNIHPYCNCASRGVSRRQDGFTLDIPSGLWVCSRCRKPSKMNWERMRGGQPHIPQPKKEVDIYYEELMYEPRKLAKKEIAEVLDWDDDDDDY